MPLHEKQTLHRVKVFPVPRETSGLLRALQAELQQCAVQHLHDHIVLLQRAVTTSVMG